MEKASPKLIKRLIQETSEFNFLMAHAISQERLLKLPGFVVEIKTLHDAMHSIPCVIHEHEHPFYELSLMRVGAMRYHCDGKDVEIEETDRGLFFMPPATTHWRESSSPYSIITGFQLELRALDEAGEAFLKKLPQLVAKAGFRFEISEEASSLPENWRKELLSGKALSPAKAALLAKEFLLDFFQGNFGAALKEKPSKEKAIKTRNAYLRDLIERIVDEKSNQAANVEEVSSSCGISARHLNRIFAEGGNVSVGRYMVLKKMEQAKRMLSDNSLLLKDVARALGYVDTAYFCRVFKKSCGMTPREYGKKARGLLGKG